MRYQGRRKSKNVILKPNPKYVRTAGASIKAETAANQPKRTSTGKAKSILEKLNETKVGKKILDKVKESVKKGGVTGAGDVTVKGYTTKSGKVVKGHVRRNRSKNGVNRPTIENYGTKGKSKDTKSTSKKSRKSKSSKSSSSSTSKQKQRKVKQVNDKLLKRLKNARKKISYTPENQNGRRKDTQTVTYHKKKTNTVGSYVRKSSSKKTANTGLAKATIARNGKTTTGKVATYSPSKLLDKARSAITVKTGSKGASRTAARTISTSGSAGILKTAAQRIAEQRKKEQELRLKRERDKKKRERALKKSQSTKN